jgi:hypothetical protein
MFEHITIPLLHMAFFAYLSFTIYVWLNKIRPITKKLIYFLVAAFTVILLIHLLWPGIEVLFNIRNFVVLFCFSGGLFFTHYFGQRAVSRVDDLEKVNKPNPTFYDFGRKLFTFAFLRLMLLAIMLFQVCFIWNTGSLNSD